MRKAPKIMLITAAALIPSGAAVSVANYNPPYSVNLGLSP